MRKRLTALFLIMTLFVTMSSLEIFAEAGDEAVENNEQIVLENNENAEDATVEEVTEPEETSTEEEPAEVVEEEPAEVTEEVTEEAAEEAEVPMLVAAAAPKGVTLTKGNVTTTSIEVKWAFSSGDVSEANPLTILMDDKEVAKITDPAADKSYKATGLAPYEKHTFTAKLSDKDSATLAVYTARGIENFRTISGYKTVLLKWDKVDGAAKYVINWSGEGKSGTVTTTKLQWKFTNKISKGKLTVKDIINLYNKKATYKFSGNLKGGDRFTFEINALDSNGNVIAADKKTGDIVKTLYYKIKFKANATLTSHSGGKVNSTFKKGQIIYARGFTEGKYIFDYKCKDGKVRTYYTMKIRVTAKLSKHITAKKNDRGANRRVPVYTEEEAEYYINERGVTSQTKYMIWANLFSQKEYVFKGKKGKWEIVTANSNGLKNRKMTTLQVSSGRATMPTSTGSTKINEKLKSQHGTPLWNVTKYFSVHGVQKSWKTPGWPESGACVRNLNKNATWIYNVIPKYSRVFVH